MPSEYDVIIVGSGPAGLFAALELSTTPDLRVLLLEKGKDLPHRHCPIIGKNQNCPPCLPCGLVSGWGGAGAFSDGKLTLSPEVGGRLPDYVGTEAAWDLIRYVDHRYLEFGATDQVYGVGPEVQSLEEKALRAGLRLVPVQLRHMGTERCRQVLKNMRSYLAERIDIKTGLSASSILSGGGGVEGVLTQDGRRWDCQHLVIAPGREGADWLVKEAGRLGLTLHSNPIDVGLRVEVLSPVMEELTSTLYESKLEFHSESFGDRIRTFCMCPAGEVTMESTGGWDPVITVNGHSYAHRKTENTNFALLVSASFSPPFREPLAYGRYIARLANIMSGGVILQRLGDLRQGRCSTAASIARGKVQPTLKSAMPGDLGFILPYRFLRGITQMLEVMDGLVPGLDVADTLLYGVEVKFYSSRLELSGALESQLPNLFAVGDGAGVTRGLIQASASGVVAAREILRRIGAAREPDVPAAEAVPRSQ